MKKVLLTVFSTLLLLSLSVGDASANHSWGNYHWARTSNPFNLKLSENLTSSWEPFLVTSSNDWSQSLVLDTTIVQGRAKGNCNPTSGQVEVCNKKYGNNGWLGIAQIWVTGGVHITQGAAKMNDTYFNTPKYNTNAWKQLVVCQEVAHTFGLDHQDEVLNNSNLGTCMDYTNNPDSNQHPNSHDYEQLVAIYSHLDSFTTLGQTTGKILRQLAPQVNTPDLEDPSSWGKTIRDNGRVGVYERDFGLGNKVITHVIWAE